MKFVSPVLAALLRSALVRGDGAPAAVPPLADAATDGVDFDREFSPMPPASGVEFPAGWVRFMEQKAAYDEARENELNLLEGAPPLRNAQPTGAYKALVLLMRFADDDIDGQPSRKDIEEKYNKDSEMSNTEQIPMAQIDPGPGAGSVRDFWKMNSDGALDLTVYVTEWITMAHNTSYYASDAPGVGCDRNITLCVGGYGLSGTMFDDGVNEALVKFAALKQDDPDFWDQFDYKRNQNVTNLMSFGVIHSGYGAEYGGTPWINNKFRIWSKKGSGIGFHVPASTDAPAHTNPARRIHTYYIAPALYGWQKSRPFRIGPLCHEFGHALGLTQELYDISYQGEGLGYYDVMAWGFKGFTNGHRGEGCPSHLSAWTKVKMGWATPEVINATTINISGTYTIRAGENQVYEIGRGMFGERAGGKEYFLLENRQPIGFDSLLPPAMAGIAIYHIEENGEQTNPGYPGQNGTTEFPENGRHYMDAMVASDGKFALEEGTTKTVPLWSNSSDLSELAPGNNTWPSTDGYFKGTETHTGIRIYDFSASGLSMTFKVTLPTRAGSDSRHVSLTSGSTTALRGTAVGRKIS